MEDTHPTVGLALDELKAALADLLGELQRSRRHSSTVRERSEDRPACYAPHAPLAHKKRRCVREGSCGSPCKSVPLATGASAPTGRGPGRVRQTRRRICRGLRVCDTSVISHRALGFNGDAASQGEKPGISVQNADALLDPAVTTYRVGLTANRGLGV